MAKKKALPKPATGKQKISKVDVKKYKEFKKKHAAPGKSRKKPAVAELEQPKSDYAKKTWYEFQQTGLLAFVNTFLHIFGWSIVLVADAAGQVIAIYPARTRFRGFTGEAMGKAYVKLSEYMHKNHRKLLDEANS